MKKLKTLISVMLCAMLVLSLVVPSMADTTATTIVINAAEGQEEGETYTAYQIFMLDYLGANNGVYTITDKGLALITEAKLNEYGFEVSATNDRDDNNNRYVFDSKEEENPQVAPNVAGLAAYLNSINILIDSGEKDAEDNPIMIEKFKTVFDYAEATSAKSNNKVSATIDVSEIGAGYYFVDTTVGSICILHSSNSTAVINDKHEDVTVEKIIEKVNGVNESQAHQENNSVQIGDKVTFKTTVTVPAGTESLVLHDEMDEGFTLVHNDDETVTVEGLDDGDYEVIIDPADDNCAFEVKLLNVVSEDIEFEVTYSAYLNENAKVMESNGSQLTNDNKTWATYGSSQRTIVDTTTTTTTQFKLKKTAGSEDGALLSGAQFKLYKGSDVVNLFKVSNTEYRLTKNGESTNCDNIITSIDFGDGVITIKGLDKDITTYVLKEEAAPDGYNRVQGNIDFELFGTEIVVNNTGSTLPETGGMGTKILFTVGGIMMVVAFVLFTSKRRMAAED